MNAELEALSAQTHLYLKERWPEFIRGVARGQTRFLAQRHLCPFLRLLFSELAPDGAAWPKTPYLQRLARLLELATTHRGTKAVITCPPAPLRGMLAACALPLWRSVTKLDARDALCVARTKSIGSEYRRRFRHGLASHHIQPIAQTARCASMTYEERSADLDRGETSLIIKGDVSWGTPFAEVQARPLRDIIVAEPFNPSELVDAERCRDLVAWLDQLREASRDNEGFPSSVVVTQRLGKGDLTDHLVSAGWKHIDIPEVAGLNCVVPVSAYKAITIRFGERVVGSSLGLHEMQQLKDSLKPAAYEALCT